MGKCTEFEVEWNKATKIKEELQREGIPFTIDSKEGKVMFQFGDLPVRQFGKVWGMFKRNDQTKSDCEKNKTNIQVLILKQDK